MRRRGRYAPARRDGVPFPSQRLNVDVSLRHSFFLPRAIFRFHVCGNPSRRSLNHTLFVSRRVLAARKAVHRARNSHPSVRPVALPILRFHPSSSLRSNRCFAATRGNPAGFLLHPANAISIRMVRLNIYRPRTD